MDREIAREEHDEYRTWLTRPSEVRRKDICFYNEYSKVKGFSVRKEEVTC
jgi:hypothetical protein